MDREPPASVFSNANKLSVFPQQVESVLRGETIAPITLEIQPSSGCNHACPKCSGKLNKDSPYYAEIRKEFTFIDPNIIRGIVNSPNSPLGVVFAGDTGDPLLHPQIESLIDIVSDKNISISVITNGQALNQSISRKIVQRCQGVRVSLDAFDAKSHQLTHGSNGEQWNELLKNIEELVKYREESQLGGECLIGIGYLTAKHTMEGIVEATKLAKNLGVDYIHFRPFFYSNDEITPELIEKCKALEDNNFSVIFPGAKYKNSKERSYQSCQAANFVTVINPKGEAYICCHHIGQDDAKIDTIGTHPEDWDNFINSNKRRDLINKYNLTECPPFCRLHSHNQTLSKGVAVDLLNQPISASHHAKFL